MVQHQPVRPHLGVVAIPLRLTQRLQHTFRVAVQRQDTQGKPEGRPLAPRPSRDPCNLDAVAVHRGANQLRRQDLPRKGGQPPGRLHQHWQRGGPGDVRPCAAWQRIRQRRNAVVQQVGDVHPTPERELQRRTSAAAAPPRQQRAEPVRLRFREIGRPERLASPPAARGNDLESGVVLVS
jgi:hypothetical protein